MRFHPILLRTPYFYFFASALIAILLSSALVKTAHAAPTAQTRRLQMPVWIERLGQRFPLRPDMELRENDVIETGASGRVWIKFSDESVLKIGSNTRLEIDNLDLDRGSKGTLQGILRFVGGVFRYTAAPADNKTERNLGVRLGTMTVSIRGTDIWGRVDPDISMVCLLEGKINVQPGTDDGFEMGEARTCTNVSKAGKAQAITEVGPQQLKKWVAKTELESGTGLSATDGAWVVNLVSYRNKVAVQNIEQRLRKAGFAVEYATVRVSQKTFYRLSVPHLESRQEANSLAKRLKDKHEIRTPWIAKSVYR